jgi:hypothetical protein
MKRSTRRAVCVAVIAVLIGAMLTVAVVPRALATDCFSDVLFSNIFHDVICLVQDLAIVAGFPDGTYRPSDLVTRGQMAAFIANTAGLIRGASTLGPNLNIGNAVGATGVVAPTTITAPTSGFIMATGTFEADAGTAFPPNASVDLQFELNGAPSGPVWRHTWTTDDEFKAVTVHNVVQVAAGTHTISLRGTRVLGFVNMDNPRVTLAFIPIAGDGSHPAGPEFLAPAQESAGGGGPGDR